MPFFEHSETDTVVRYCEVACDWEGCHNRIQYVTELPNTKEQAEHEARGHLWDIQEDYYTCPQHRLRSLEMNSRIGLEIHPKAGEVILCAPADLVDLLQNIFDECGVSYLPVHAHHRVIRLPAWNGDVESKAKQVRAALDWWDGHKFLPS
jgi:hypothetical protein